MSEAAKKIAFVLVVTEIARVRFGGKLYEKGAEFPVDEKEIERAEPLIQQGYLKVKELSEEELAELEKAEADAEKKEQKAAASTEAAKNAEAEKPAEKPAKKGNK